MNRTQGRGETNTVAGSVPLAGFRRPGVWAVRDVRLPVLFITIVVALAIHILPHPLAALFRIWLRTNTEETGPFEEDKEVVIPIELDSQMVAQNPSSPKTEAPQNPSVVSDDDADDDDDEGQPDAGAPDAGPDAGEEVVLDAGVDAGAPDAGSPGGQGKDLPDPLKVAGDPGRFSAKDPNVRVYLAADRIRNHPLGSSFAALLVSIPEWTEVIGGTGIDPIRDFDHVLLSGPQFRHPVHVVATMDFNIPVAKMRQAIEASMARSDPRGRWLTGYDFPVASLGDDGYRRAVLLPNKRIFMLLPAAAEDQIPSLKNLKPFSKSGEPVIVLYLVTPWRAFLGTKVSVPKRIKWMRLSLLPVNSGSGPASGGYNLLVEGEDESADAAEEDMKEMRQAIEDVRFIGAFGMGIEVIGKPVFTTEDNLIRARAHVSNRQVQRIIGFVKLEMENRARQLKRRRRVRKPPATIPTGQPG